MLKRIFSRTARESHRRSKELEAAFAEAIASLHPTEVDAVHASVNQFKLSHRRSIGTDSRLYEERLNEIWHPWSPSRHPEPFVSDTAVLYSFDFPDPDRDDEDKNLPWAISLSDEFIKETTSIDRKLQGRILESLIQLASRPMELRGDTQKPLTGNLSGLWRMRLGDYRLIYRPDRKAKRVYCLAFSSRGGAYA